MSHPDLTPRQPEVEFGATEYAPPYEAPHQPGVEFGGAEPDLSNVFFDPVEPNANIAEGGLSPTVFQPGEIDRSSTIHVAPDESVEELPEWAVEDPSHVAEGGLSPAVIDPDLVDTSGTIAVAPDDYDSGY